MDREKVIRGLELCVDGHPCMGEKFISCPFSPRNNPEQNCGVTMAENALALLKEQEAVEPYQFEDIWKCGKCGDGVVAYDELGVSGIENVRFNYCPTCGKAVKWE